MSLTTYLLLLDRTCLLERVEPLVAAVLAGRANDVAAFLEAKITTVTAMLDAPPHTFFQHHLQLGIDTLGGRLREAFVNEMEPVIVDPLKAWEHNVATHVRGALALSLCTVRPSAAFSPALVFGGRFSLVVCRASPTADDVSNHDDPTRVETTCTGIFQEPEVFIRKSCVQEIWQEIQPLFSRISALDEDERTIRSIQHFHAMVSACLDDPRLAILRGYL